MTQIICWWSSRRTGSSPFLENTIPVLKLLMVVKFLNPDSLPAYLCRSVHGEEISNSHFAMQCKVLGRHKRIDRLPARVSMFPLVAEKALCSRDTRWTLRVIGNVQ